MSLEKLSRRVLVLFGKDFLCIFLQRVVSTFILRLGHVNSPIGHIDDLYGLSTSLGRAGHGGTTS